MAVHGTNGGQGQCGIEVISSVPTTNYLIDFGQGLSFSMSQLPSSVVTEFKWFSKPLVICSYIPINQLIEDKSLSCVCAHMRVHAYVCVLTICGKIH